MVFTDAGAAGAPVVVRGVGASRPRVAGGVNTIEAAANHYVFENLDLSGSRAVAGTNNWVAAGSTHVPPEWTGTLTGAEPGLVEPDDLAALDLRPAGAASPLVDSAGAPPPAFTAHPFPAPLGTPLFSPLHGTGTVARTIAGAIDRGAYELGAAPPDPGGDPDPGDPDAGGGVGGGCASNVRAGAGALLAGLAMLVRAALRRRAR